jgi:hypothetical protein
MAPKNSMDNLGKLWTIVEQGQHARLKFTDGVIDVDQLTANAIVKVYRALNEDNQAKMRQHLNSDKYMFRRMVSFAWSHVN